MKKKFVLCGCDAGGREFLSLTGRENTAYFCDDKYKGQVVDGVEIIGFDELKEIHKAYDVVITNRNLTNQIATFLDAQKIPFKLAYGGKDFFNFWRQLFFLSLTGMNIGGGGSVFESGEAVALQILKNVFGVSKIPTLFDVGANIGKYTLLLANLFPNATIHSFEPGHTTYAAFNTNTESLQMGGGGG